MGERDRGSGFRAVATVPRAFWPGASSCPCRAARNAMTSATFHSCHSGRASWSPSEPSWKCQAAPSQSSFISSRQMRQTTFRAASNSMK